MTALSSCIIFVSRSLLSFSPAILPHFSLQAVIVSPLFRTLETASGVFGGGTIDNGQKMLMVEQVPVKNEVTRHYAIAERPGVPFIANEQCRERMSECFAV